MNPPSITSNLGRLLDRAATRDVKVETSGAKFSVKGERSFMQRIVKWLRPQHAEARRLGQMEKFLNQLQHHYGQDGAHSVRTLLYSPSTGRVMPLTKRNVRTAALRAEVYARQLPADYPTAAEPVRFDPPVHPPMQATVSLLHGNDDRNEAPAPQDALAAAHANPKPANQHIPPAPAPSYNPENHARFDEDAGIDITLRSKPETQPAGKRIWDKLAQTPLPKSEASSPPAKRIWEKLAETPLPETKTTPPKTSE